MKPNRIYLLVISLIILFSLGVPSAAARPNLATAGTAFTYQGELVYQGALANGSFDFKFSLYNALTGGAPVGSTLTKSGVTVTDGRFTVQLDFGTGIFTGDAHWLAIEVQTAGGSGFTTLSPLQELTPTPYAIYALTATTATTATNAWSLTGNSGTTAGTNFLGTTDDVALYFKVNNENAFRIYPDATSPNLIGGYNGNTVAGGVEGATIAGGGLSGSINSVSANYATVGGGNGNAASADFATVGGGDDNKAEGQYATVGGGSINSASKDYATVGGGQSNTAQRLSIHGRWWESQRSQQE